MKFKAIKYKICLISLMMFVLPYIASAQVCSPDGYTILTINGIFTDEDGAIINKENLKKLLPPNFNNQPLTVDFVHNETHVAGIRDLIDAVAQGLFDQKSDYDLTEILNDASQKVNTQKLLLVTHSQGNFYGNNFYDKVADMQGGVPAQSIGMYGVASPASRVAGGGRYVTSDTDEVIAKTTARFIKILPPNIHIPLEPIDDNGHSFSDVYLKYESSRIITDIKSSLDRLQNNNIQDQNGPCLAPPKLTLAHKIEGLALAKVDPLAGVAKIGVIVTVTASKAAGIAMAEGSVAFGNAVLKVAVKTTNGAIAFGNTVLKGVALATNATASALGSLGKSIKNIATDTGAKNQANVIDAVSSENPSPEVVPIGNPILPIAKLVEKKSLIAQVFAVETPKVIPQEVPKDVKDILVSIVPPPVVAEIEKPVKRVSRGGGRSSPPPEEPKEPEEVVVVEEPPQEEEPVPDTTAPTITITGANPMVLKLNTSYEELGATVTDDVDELVEVITTGTVNIALGGTYTITYTATDTAGNVATTTREVKVVPQLYVPFTFGTGNGDGNDWQAWYFNGAVVYDWSDTYVDHYLKQQFKVNRFGSGTLYCSNCLVHGVFTTNPLLGFDTPDIVVLGGLQGNLMHDGLDFTYDVIHQWDATGYSYHISHDGILFIEGHIDLPGVNKDMWSGWTSLRDAVPYFTPSPGYWVGSEHFAPEGFSGGYSLTLQPYPVYVE